MANKEKGPISRAFDGEAMVTHFDPSAHAHLHELTVESAESPEFDE
jgi:hypothetical protein